MILTQDHFNDVHLVTVGFVSVKVFLNITFILYNLNMFSHNFNVIIDIRKLVTTSLPLTYKISYDI